MSALGKVSQATAPKLKAFHPDIPDEKLPAIIARTFIGIFLVLVGLVLMGGAAGVLLSLVFKRQTPTVLEFSGLGGMGVAGLFLFFWGAITVAGRLVKQPLGLAVATFGGIVNIWRGGK